MTPTAVAYALPMQRDVAAFHDAFGMPNLIASPRALPLSRIELRVGLIREEGVAELRLAADRRDPVLAIDALVDTIYVALGALVEMGQDASALQRFDDRPRRDMDLDALLDGAKAVAISNEMYLPMLEAAFRREDIEASVSILDTIVTSAVFTLLGAGIDPQPFFNEVQRANMSKLGADGKPVYSRGMELDGFPEGKVLKGANYSAPNLRAIFAGLYRDAIAEPATPAVTDDFERGARAAAEAMRFYFLDENEAPIYHIGTDELETFEKGAVADALRDEQLRLERNGR